MKKLLLLTGLSLATITPVFAQGYLDFSWFAAGQPAGTGIKIAAPSNPASQQAGWYTGSDYSVEAYMATGNGAAEGSLAAQSTVMTTFFGATSASGGPTADGAGVWGQGLAQSGIPVGPATIQVRVWYNGGQYATYEAALAAGVNTGKSALYNITLVDNLGTPSSMDSIQMAAFTVSGASVTPEPSTFALAGLGAAALLIFRRRK